MQTTFTIPDGQKNGVYMVHTLDNGTEVHTRIRDLPRTTRRRGTIGNELTSDFPIYQVKCFPEEGLQDLDHRTCDSANAALDELCGEGLEVDAGHSAYFVSECVVAYYCHLARSTMKGPTVCTAANRRLASLEITNGCGRYKPGQAGRRITDSLTDDFEDFIWGYESYCTSKGREFCTSGL